MKAVLVLEDGTLVEGEGFGKEGKAFGELVFATGMTGYTESLTDPSYTGQILMFTYPLLGNYGVNKEDYESDGVKVEGVVAREACFKPSSWRSEKDIDEFLRQFRRPGIYGVDTRFLTKRIRSYGTMKCVLQTYNSSNQIDFNKLKVEARTQKDISELNLVERVSSVEIKQLKTDRGNYQVVLIDCGLKKSIVTHLLNIGCDVIVVPYNTSARQILNYQPDAVLVSNGPGNPAIVTETISAVKELIGKTVLYGICLGHQIIALALGGETYKLKFGHRGVNQPVKDFETGRVFISTQNHGFAVKEQGLQQLGLEITQINLNDKTIEGLKHRDLPIKTVQYHPEAGPGPHDTFFFFENLIKDMNEHAQKN